MEENEEMESHKKEEKYRKSWAQTTTKKRKRRNGEREWSNLTDHHEPSSLAQLGVEHEDVRDQNSEWARHSQKGDEKREVALFIDALEDS